MVSIRLIKIESEPKQTKFEFFKLPSNWQLVTISCNLNFNFLSFICVSGVDIYYILGYFLRCKVVRDTHEVT